jgi:hypothetical protein
LKVTGAQIGDLLDAAASVEHGRQESIITAATSHLAPLRRGVGHSVTTSLAPFSLP